MTLQPEIAPPTLGAAVPPPAGVAVGPAAVDHVDAIHRLIEVTSRRSTVLPRTQASILEHLRSFVLAWDGPELVGCGSLHLWTPDLGEIKSLAVAEPWRGKGLGSRLVQALLDEARRLRLPRVFALTDRVGFFTRNGFRLTDKATLPHKVWNECIFCPKFHDCGEVALDLNLPLD